MGELLTFCAGEDPASIAHTREVLLAKGHCPQTIEAARADLIDLGIVHTDGGDLFDVR